MNFKASVSLNEQQILNKVMNDDFGLKAATEWKDILDPFTPRRTGRTVETAEVTPWQIKYDPVAQIDQYWLGEIPSGEHYGKKIYYENREDYFHTSFHYPQWCPAPFHNPLSTGKWDKAAEEAGKKKELYSRLNAYLRSK